MNCPICNKEKSLNPRYPNEICRDCYSLSTDINGRKLLFYNAYAGGGYKSVYEDTDEVYDSNTCYVNGIECFADEARFGGIVIEKV